MFEFSRLLARESSLDCLKSRFRDPRVVAFRFVYFWLALDKAGSELTRSTGWVSFLGCAGLSWLQLQFALRVAKLGPLGRSSEGIRMCQLQIIEVTNFKPFLS